MACSSSAASQLLCYWWGCGWGICGTTQCCAKSTPDSFTYQNPGPIIHYISARIINFHICFLLGFFRKWSNKWLLRTVFVCLFVIWGSLPGGTWLKRLPKEVSRGIRYRCLSSSTPSSSQLQLVIMEKKNPPSWERSRRANQSVLLDFMRICCVLSFHLHEPLRTCCRSDLHYNRHFTRSLTPPWRQPMKSSVNICRQILLSQLLEYFASLSRLILAFTALVVVVTSNERTPHSSHFAMRESSKLRRPWCHDHRQPTIDWHY